MNARSHLFMRIGLLALIAAALAFATPVMAQHGHEEKPVKGHSMKGAAKGAAALKTPAAIWKEVTKHALQLDKSIQAKKLGDVHEHAFAVRDYVKMLPAKSTRLSAATKAKLTKGVGTVTSLASELDEAGDSGKQAETEALNKKMHTVLNAIKGLYPASVWKK
jgi:hypothetical protein